MKPGTKRFLTMLAFISPWILGFLGFFVYPLLLSLYYSFTEYNLLQSPKWVGLQNYRSLPEDTHYVNAVGNTVYFVVFSVPLGVLTAFIIAFLLNQQLRLRVLLRMIFYIPIVVPISATAILWMWIFNSNWGLLNNLLDLVGINGPSWLGSPTWSKPSLIIMQLWLVGGSVLIFLAALQDVPRALYDAAMVDGANALRRVWHVTIPMVTPAILFSLLTGLIAAFQTFANAWIMTSGGPIRSTEFYVLYLYDNGFRYFRMGYASAMAWILFGVVVVVTVILFRTSARWVYYGGEG
ncbi:MAG: sugar ABC transporter permease [Caldilineaceae bacterium]|nr:sugar ABC transporter permease [Caldilineaceae bacterium]MCY4092343.1 sugar ABC transporter permease [Caldilineaceae bacterium]MDE0071276.1 sugar ABC transporter permease [Caldilineaceae bacterium]MDE0180737.1 sugar ABC transporter permease [Caldilineaceae bacterium]MDE0429654.1 sugar ABC transporter permease [Caldilineaceae bacterium]